MPARLQRKMCLSCGFDGRAIQDDHRTTGWFCPRCSADLYARPPRSYADLEALSDSNPAHVDAPQPVIARVTINRHSDSKGASRERPRWARLSIALGLLLMALGVGVLLALAPLR